MFICAVINKMQRLKNLPSDMCAQKRFRSPCALAQSKQNIHRPHFGLPRMQRFFIRTTKILIRLRDCIVLFESSLSAHVRRYVCSWCGSVLYHSGRNVFPSWRLCHGYIITKTCLYNVDPLKPHFYIVKLGFTGVYIIFLISAQKHRLWVLVRTASPRRF